MSFPMIYKAANRKKLSYSKVLTNHFDTQLESIKLGVSVVFLMSSQFMASQLIHATHWRLPNETILPASIGVLTLELVFWIVLIIALWQLVTLVNNLFRNL